MRIYSESFTCFPNVQLVFISMKQCIMIQNHSLTSKGQQEAEAHDVKFCNVQKNGTSFYVFTVSSYDKSGLNSEIPSAA